MFQQQVTSLWHEDGFRPRLGTCMTSGFKFQKWFARWYQLTYFRSYNVFSLAAKGCISGKNSETLSVIDYYYISEELVKEVDVFDIDA